MTTLSTEVKNTQTLSLETKDTGRTWDESINTWDEETGTWDNPGVPISEEAKNVIALSYEVKS